MVSFLRTKPPKPKPQTAIPAPGKTPQQSKLRRRGFITLIGYLETPASDDWLAAAKDAGTGTWYRSSEPKGDRDGGGSFYSSIHVVFLSTDGEEESALGYCWDSVYSVWKKGVQSFWWGHWGGPLMALLCLGHGPFQGSTPIRPLGAETWKRGPPGSLKAKWAANVGGVGRRGGGEWGATVQLPQQYGPGKLSPGPPSGQLRNPLWSVVSGSMPLQSFPTLHLRLPFFHWFC